MTVVKLPRARVKRKGQVTIPQELRIKHGIEDGVIIDFIDQTDGILIKTLPPIEPGEPVGEEEYKKIIAQLDQGRRNPR
ncbi:MAG: AbrB/MazE/SpoVT family DNA-binding domain-containing protein [Candidatus Bathyarchaeota archaeon]|nr:AbrB/MazE/SpoVT family DNA-binding domain-containing protein [Candidatus Bathyarchaeota archaeon]